MKPVALALLLAAATALAGCIGPSSNPGEPTPTDVEPRPGGNATGNATRANATAPPSDAPSGPQKVHDASYAWQVNPPTEVTFDVPRAASLEVNVTQEGPGVGTFSVELVDPRATSAGKADVNAAGPPSGTPVTFRARGDAGSWTLRFSGTGVGGVKVTVLAT